MSSVYGLTAVHLIIEFAFCQRYSAGAVLSSFQHFSSSTISHCLCLFTWRKRITRLPNSSRGAAELVKATETSTASACSRAVLLTSRTTSRSVTRRRAGPRRSPSSVSVSTWIMTCAPLYSRALLNSVVTGIDFLGGLRCTGDCLWGDNTTPPAVLWQLDGAPINSIGQGSINGSYFPGLSTSELLETLTATLIRVRDLAGGDAGLHTLTISSSTQPVEQDIRATLQIIARYVIVYTGAGTLIGPNDSVWIPARHAWFRYERSWFDVERPCEGLRQSPRVGSSAATNFVGECLNPSLAHGVNIVS